MDRSHRERFWAVCTTPTGAPLELDRLLPSYAPQSAMTAPRSPTSVGSSLPGFSSGRSEATFQEASMNPGVPDATDRSAMFSPSWDAYVFSAQAPCRSLRDGSSRRDSPGIHRLPRSDGQSSTRALAAPVRLRQARARPNGAAPILRDGELGGRRELDDGSVLSAPWANRQRRWLLSSCFPTGSLTNAC